MKPQLRTKSVFGLITLLTVFSACTDKRPREIIQEPVTIPQPLPIVQLIPGEYRIDNKNIEVDKMTVKDGSLYITGRPFAFSRWNLTADPESPNVVFVASDTLGALDSGFAPIETMGVWRPDWHASGSIAVSGSKVYTSGTAGLSVIDISDTHNPVVRKMYPPSSEDGFVSDGRFVYKAMVIDPARKRLFGFRQQDFIFALSTAAFPSLSLLGQVQYPGGDACCVSSSAQVGNKVFLALGTRMQVYEFSAAGALKMLGSVNSMNAVNVFATPNMLYVHHRPSSSGTSNLPTGIYVFDKNLQFVNSLPIDPIEFAVNDQDSHVYVNETNSSVRIYRILWENMQ